MSGREKKSATEIVRSADFEYVRELPSHLKRFAAYYEYFRESETHRKVIAAFRDAILSKGNFEEVTPETVEDQGVFPDEVISALAGTAAFPVHSFQAALADTERIFDFLPSRRQGLYAVPWKDILLLRDLFVNRGGSEIEFFGTMRGLTSFNAISIQWDYTNDELLDLMKEAISRLRPAVIPAPPKAGRAGRGSRAGTMDMLNQLSALREDRAGVPFEARSLKMTYTSLKGWRKAIAQAQKRILSLATVPLFPISSVTN